MLDTINIATSGNCLEVSVSGKLTKEFYEDFVPAVEKLINEHGKINILMLMHDFHGWTAGALWEDTKFALKHFGGMERLAVIGETKWQKGMASFCKPFTKAEVRYFDHSQVEEARTWLGLEMAGTA